MKGGEKKLVEKTSNQNVMGAAAYLLGPLTGVIFLLLEKKDKFIRFHAMQSTILFGGLFVLNFALGFIPLLGWLAGLILSMASFVLWIVLMWKAFNGEEYEVPYIGKIAREQLAKLS